VPGTPRSLLPMSSNLKNSAALTAAQSRSPWVEHRAPTAWESCRAPELRQGYGEVPTQPPPPVILGEGGSASLSYSLQRANRSQRHPKQMRGEPRPCLAPRGSMRLWWLSACREKPHVAFLEAAPPRVILEESWSQRKPIQSLSPSLEGKEVAHKSKIGFSSESQEGHVISHQPKPLLFVTE